MFEDRANLKDLIVTILREEPASISGIQKRLAQHGENLHRLIVTGYLRALNDLGLLDETNLPPSKVYRLKTGHKEVDVYDAAGRTVAGLDLSRTAEARVLVASLARLFRRPVFKEEVERTATEPVGLGDWEVETKDRQAARQLLVQAGFQLPHNNPAYLPPDEVAEELRPYVDEVLERLVVRGFHAHPYMMRSRQVTLGDM